MNKNRYRFLICAAVIICCILSAACAGGNDAEYDFRAYDFVIENDRGTYTAGQITLPETDGSCPLVFIAHGFRGTMNSGGAEELSQRLSQHGIAAVRIDFNSRLEPEADSAGADEYTLSDMTDDAVLAISYCADRYNIDTDRIGLYGRSMGGRAVMIMANESRGYDYKALALVAPAGNDSAMIYYMGGEDKWNEMKSEADRAGYTLKQGLKLTPQWFREFEEYNPADTGYKFGDKPVLLFYNTLDNVVLPDTSLECAAGYRNCSVVRVTADDGHGYEMSYKDSELKDMIMDRITEHFEGALCTN